MSGTNEHIPRTIRENLSYLFYFYRYLFKNQGKELLVVGVVNFLIGLAPILLVILFELKGLDGEKLRQFYGDGSMIIFCFGVLVSFLTINFAKLNLRTKTTEDGNNISNNNILLLSLSIIYYISAYKIFEKAQTNFDRSWEFIYWINGISGLFLIVAFFIIVYVKFSSEYNYAVIHPYMEDTRAKRKAKRAAKKQERKWWKFWKKRNSANQNDEDEEIEL